MKVSVIPTSAVIVSYESPEFDNIVGDGICIFQGALYKHASTVIWNPDDASDRRLWEMTSPRLRCTPLAECDWADAFALPLAEPLSPFQNRMLWDWWKGRLGLKYPYIDLVDTMRWITWNRFCNWSSKWPGMGWMQKAQTGPLWRSENGYCSVNVAWGLQRAGRFFGDPLKATPVSLTWEGCFEKMEKVEAA